VAIAVTLLTRRDCALCDHAKQVLTTLGDEFPLEVRELDLATSEGRALGVTTGMAFPPALLIDGEPVGFGRLSERRLRRELTRRAGARPAGG
jgi:glutaredoxin